jgi:hypothetical protein
MPGYLVGESALSWASGEAGLGAAFNVAGLTRVFRTDQTCRQFSHRNHAASDMVEMSGRYHACRSRQCGHRRGGVGRDSMGLVSAAYMVNGGVFDTGSRHR